MRKENVINAAHRDNHNNIPSPISHHTHLCDQKGNSREHEKQSWLVTRL